MDNQFKCGDVVVLKGHNVLMTVKFAPGDLDMGRDGSEFPHTRYICCWFSSNNELQRANFLPESLEPLVKNV